MTLSTAKTDFDPVTTPHAGWELFPHDADIGVRGFGPTREAAFEQAALALTAAIINPRRVLARKIVEITCEAPDDEFLLLEWLNALAFEMAARHMLFSRFAVHIHDGHLKGWAWGERLDARRHQATAQVKGATIAALEVTRKPDGGWLAQCAVDV